MDDVTYSLVCTAAQHPDAQSPHFLSVLNAEHKARQARLWGLPAVAAHAHAAPPPPPSSTISAPDPLDALRDRIFCKDIFDIVARRFLVTPKQLCGTEHGHPVADYRHLALWLCRNITHSSLAEIGRLAAQCAGRHRPFDHSTVWNSHNRTEARMETDPVFRDAVMALRADIIAKAVED